MSDERLSKAERREKAREERRAAEEAAKKAAAKSRLTTSLITLVSVAVIGGLVFLAITNGDTEVLTDTLLVRSSEADAGASAAGCEVVVEDTPLPDATHYNPGEAPPADALYGTVRPTHSGPHYASVLPVDIDGANSQIEERAVTHNMEHGAVVVQYDPDQLPGGDVDALKALTETLNSNGFANTRTGAGIFVGPYTEPGISSGKALAIRSWGNAVDCDGYDENVLLQYIVEKYGDHGCAPEGGFTPYPEGVLQFEEGDESDYNCRSMGESRHNGEAPAQLETEADGNIVTDGDATEEGADDAGDEATDSEG